MHVSDFTFIIVTFRSEELIDECLKDLPINDSFIDIFSQLKQQGYKIAIASNHI